MIKAASVVLALVFVATVPGARAQEVVTPKQGEVDPKKIPLTPIFEKKEADECPETSSKCKLVCKFFDPPTGTRLGGHTECRTVYWWEDRMRQDQAAILKLQEDATHLAVVH
jgi:hypothetical protein